MKKSFLSVLALLIISVVANATDYSYTTKCPTWEHGDVVYYNGVQQNVAGSSPNAFCWDAVIIDGAAKVSGSFYYPVYESLTMTSSIYDWYAYYVSNWYGEDYIGVKVVVVVMGIPQSVPTVKLGSKIGVLYETKNIYSPSGSILNGKEYTFFMRHIPVSSVTGDSDLDINDDLDVFDGATLKDSTQIN